MLFEHGYAMHKVSLYLIIRMYDWFSFEVGYFIPSQLNYQFGNEEGINGLINRYVIMDILRYFRILIRRNNVIGVQVIDDRFFEITEIK